jgi:aspartyl/asparaginyl-tRNA synthetase
LRQAIKLIEEGKLVKKELAITRLVVADQARRIEVKDSAIHILHKKDTAWQLMVISYQDAIKILREKDQLQMQFIGKLEKDLKRGKRKTLFTQIIAGVITIGAVVWAITK